MTKKRTQGPGVATAAAATIQPSDVPTPRQVALDLAHRIREHRQTLAGLEAQGKAAEAGANLAEAPILPSDEGVVVQQVSPTELVNMDQRSLAAKSIRLHVRGRAYEHVGETVDGSWTYRHDR